MRTKLLSTNSLHRINRLVKSSRIKAAGILACDLLGLRHLVVRLDPVNACNLRCQMCYFSDESWVKTNAQGRFSDEDLAEVASQFFPFALQVHIGCTYEPTMFKNYEQIVRIAREARVPFVSMVTNGMLLKREKLEAMVRWGLDELTISCHGVRKETYESLMKGADHSRFLAQMKMIQEVREAAGRKAFSLRVNFTVNPDNIDELSAFFDVYGEFDIDTLQIRPMIDLDGAYQKNTARSIDAVVTEYRDVVRGLVSEARGRNMAILANTDDPLYEESDDAATLYVEAVRRFVRPSLVWRPDFSYKDENYRDVYKKSDIRKKLLRAALFGPPKMTGLHTARSRIS